MLTRDINRLIDWLCHCSMLLKRENKIEWILYLPSHTTCSALKTWPFFILSIRLAVIFLDILEIISVLQKKSPVYLDVIFVCEHRQLDNENLLDLTADIYGIHWNFGYNVFGVFTFTIFSYSWRYPRDRNSWRGAYATEVFSLLLQLYYFSALFIARSTVCIWYKNRWRVADAQRNELMQYLQQVDRARTGDDGLRTRMANERRLRG